MSHRRHFFKNWKSSLAFLVFVGVYVYTIKNGSDYRVVDTAGYIALYSSLFMMFRSDFTKEMVAKIVDKITFKRED